MDERPPFAPGSPLAVCAEPENPYDPLAVAVWNATRTVCAGYVPRHIADLMPPLSVDRCGVVLSEQTEEGVRVSLGILVSREPIALHVVPASLVCRVPWCFVFVAELCPCPCPLDLGTRVS